MAWHGMHANGSRQDRRLVRKPIINSSLLEVRSGSNGKWLTTHTGELLLRSGDWEQYVVTSDKFFFKKK